MAVRTLWKYVVGRSKTLIKNYNAIERAEKIMESDVKRPPPRHPGTEAKFKVLIKGSDLENVDMGKKPIELLDRLKIVKVSSSNDFQDDKKEEKQLPEVRTRQKLPTFGYEEPKTITEGRCTLRQALEFISNYQNDPVKHSINAIAENYKLKSSDVENIIKNFRAFELHLSKDRKYDIAKSAMKTLGANKVVEPVYDTKFIGFDEETENKPDSPNTAK